MSEKKAKQERKLEVMTEEADAKKVADEMAKSICKMYEDRDKKALNAKDTLASHLRVTSDKYKTANGVMAAIDTLREVCGNDYLEVADMIEVAKGVASRMSAVAADMANEAEGCDPEDLDMLCERFFDPNFCHSGETSVMEMVVELMCLSLCQNVGPDANDVVDFIRTADEEIEKARKNLRKHCEDNGIDFEELCGPHDGCHDCLCMSCAKDCKEAKEIVEGQSAYEVCEDFVEKE